MRRADKIQNLIGIHRNQASEENATLWGGKIGMGSKGEKQSLSKGHVLKIRHSMA